MAVQHSSYSGTYNALAVGNVLQGWELSYTSFGRPITADAFGQLVLDRLSAGLQMFVDFIATDWDAAAFNYLRWWFSAAIGASQPAGQSKFSRALPLILTACDNTAHPATITFYKAILADDFDTRILFSSRERYIPLRMEIYPVRCTIAGSVVTLKDSEGATTTDISQVAQPTGCNPFTFFVET